MSQKEHETALVLAAELQQIVRKIHLPPSEIAPSIEQPVVYMAMVRNTRGYIERVAHQANGAYANAWYDACAVMIRRLVETLIIECYEAHNLPEKIKDATGNYIFLKDLVDRALLEKSWTIGRTVRSALPRIKELGDKSAHNRRYNAHREDIDKLAKDLRDTIQELLVLAKLK